MASKEEKKLVRDIIMGIDDKIPFNYVHDVNQILNNWGYNFDDVSIRNTRQLRNSNIIIAKALSILVKNRDQSCETDLAKKYGLEKKS